MPKKAQVLMIFLWILLIVSLLAVAIGHRVSLGLRLSRYHRDKLKAVYLGKAAINRAIAELEKDTNNYDTLFEPWADNEEAFKELMLGDNPNEYSTISYINKENDREAIIYGVVDEERKININTATIESLTALLEKCEITGASQIVANILIWRGDIADLSKIYEELGYPAKGKKFSNIEELALVKDIDADILKKLRGLVTVYGSGKININTASVDVLTIIVRAAAKRLAIGEDFTDALVAKIIDARNINGFFKDKGEITITPTGEEELNLFNAVKEELIVKSDNFLIEVTGNASRINCRVSAVFNRKEKQVLSWHEN